MGPGRSWKRRLRPTTAARCGPVAPAHGLYLVKVDY